MSGRLGHRSPTPPLTTKDGSVSAREAVAGGGKRHALCGSLCAASGPFFFFFLPTRVTTGPSYFFFSSFFCKTHATHKMKNTLARVAGKQENANKRKRKRREGAGTERLKEAADKRMTASTEG